MKSILNATLNNSGVIHHRLNANYNRTRMAVYDAITESRK